MLDILLINFVVVIYTLSGLDVSVRRFLWNRLYPGAKFDDNWLVKPLSCSWCLGTWLGLISLFWIGFTELNIFLVLIIAFYNDIIKDVMILIKDLITKMISSVI